MNELALFAGAGGGILGGKLLGWTTVCAVEWEAYPASVLIARQNEGVLPPFPIWDDVRTFDGRPWRGRVDVVSGGFPCQDISAAGKGAGIDGERSGMWAHMARIVREVGPRYVFVENSPMLTSRGLGRVLGDLAAMGYDAQWGVLGAVDAGAPHKRDRIWIVANSNSGRRWKTRKCGRLEEIRTGWSDKRMPATQSSSDVADTESKQDNRRGRRDLDNTACCGEGGDTATCSGRENVPNPLCDGSQRCRQDRNTAGQAGLRSGTRSDKEQCVCNATGEGLQNGRGAQVGEPGAIEELKRSGCVDVSDTDGTGSQRLHETGCDVQSSSERVYAEPTGACSGSGTWWAVEPDVGRVAHGVASRVDRLKAIGNGQVPIVAALAWRILSK